MILNFLRKQNKNTTFRLWLGIFQTFLVPRPGASLGTRKKTHFYILILIYLRNSGNYTGVTMEQSGQFSLKGERLGFVGAKWLFGQRVARKSVGA